MARVLFAPFRKVASATRRVAATALLCASIVVSFALPDATATVGDIASASRHRADGAIDLLDRVGALPLAFEENRGQAEPHVRFLSRGDAYDAFFTGRGADVVLRHPGRARPSTIGIRFVGGGDEIEPVEIRPVGAEPLPGKTNYFIGDDPHAHIVDIATFAQVRYASVYPGIDLVYYGNRGQLEYDLIVAPRADPGRITMEIAGVVGIELTRDGHLVLGTRAGSVELRKPIAYQEIGGERREVATEYVIASNDRIGFGLGAYDPEHTLVIDPLLTLSTTLWGSVKGVALDAARNIYVVGTTTSAGLPATGGYQTQMAGTQDAYVAKLNPDGTAVIYATYLGARRATTSGRTIAVDGAGSAYVTGTTTSTSFPITPNAYQSFGPTFVTKLGPAGNVLAYSTFVTSPVESMVVDAVGNAYMTGTASFLETTPGAFQPVSPGSSSAYVAKLNAGATAMLYATYLGGSAVDYGQGIAIDGAGNAYVVGTTRSTDFPTKNPLRGSLGGATDAFVTKVNPTGTALEYSTYLGGTAEERGFGIAVDATGHAYVTGWTESMDFPSTPNAFQRTIGYPDPAISNAFVAKLDSAGSSLVYASYLGGAWILTATVHVCLSVFGPDEGLDVGTSIAVDAAGYAYVGGYVTSTEFPLVDSMQAVGTEGDGWHIPMITKVAPGGDRLVYAAVLGSKVQGGTVNQVAIDGLGGAIVAGTTLAASFPHTSGAVGGTGGDVLFKVSNGKYPTTVQASANPVGRSQSVTLTANVLTPTPGGVITFNDGTSSLGSVVANSGVARLSLTLAPGIHRITAANSADGLVSPPHFQIVRGQ